jgi:hypothetical protein
MTVSDWVSVVAALVGAVVGGIMALVGAVFVARREQLRATRMRLFEALDGLRATLSDPGQLTRVDLRELQRAAPLLGWRKQKAIRAIEHLAATPLPSPPPRPPPGEDRPGPDENPTVTRYRRAREQMADEVEVLERLVLRRLARVF